MHQKSEDDIRDKFYLILWPRHNILCKEVLKEQGVLGDLKILDFNFDLIPLEKDLLSLEMEFSFRDTYIDYDLCLHQQVAESIQRLQVIYGKCTHIVGKGTGAKKVIEILAKEEEEDLVDEKVNDISNIIILDRNIDWMTPLCLQLTYEGMIDEVFGIHHNRLHLSPEVLARKERRGDVDILNLSDQNHTFSLCRNMSFSSVKNFLAAQANHYKSIIEEKK